MVHGEKLLLLILLFAIFGNSKLSAAAVNTEQADRRKLATGNPGFISIDCGVDEDYTDEETGIFYQSDKDFINAGTNFDVSPEYNIPVPYLGRQLKNLRSFPEGRKNCYKLQPEAGKNHNYNIRVFFRYGNYNGKNQLPKFDLYLGVNYWVTVEMRPDTPRQMYEIIHLSLTDVIHVCLVKTGSYDPFISALELRLLDQSVYRVESGALLTILLHDVGNLTNLSTRYKDDPYDRIWLTHDFSNSVAINTTFAMDSRGSNDLYKLPGEVLRTAAKPGSGFSSLNFFYGTSYAHYVYFHFAEIANIPPNQTREFTITLNGFKYDPITLEYLKPQSIRPQTSPITGNLSFSIEPTAESDLPPILNAFEVLRVWPLSSVPTQPEDVDAMTAIQQTYKVIREDWQGDPCLPRGFSWSGLSCNTDVPPRIISLNLSSSKLSGDIASAFSNFSAMHSLDLSYNELTGPVPEFLAKLPNLTILNLSGNKLTGPIPQALKDKSMDGTLQFSIAENPNLCQMDSCQKEEKNLSLPIIASITSAGVLLLLSATAIIWRIKRKRHVEVTNPKMIMEAKNEWLAKPRNRPFTYCEILDITDNFKTIIGEGGFGKVYLGNLKDKTLVAVKLLSQSSKQGCKEFQTEVQLLMIVHHKNLVSLIGYCDEGENMALVYEYMVNGNLRQKLSEKSQNVLTWNERLQIAMDAAQGLEYLHNGCKPPIIHRDLKTANILLNENMQAKIADFGLSRAFATERDSHVSTLPAGTFGYLDPECRASGNLSKKSDVYSFGIILFELITGLPVITKGDEYNTHILELVGPLIERGDIKSLVDPRLHRQLDTNSAWKTVEIAMSCVPRTAAQRPDMSHVVAELRECLAMETVSGIAQGTDQAVSNNSLDISSLVAR